MPFLRLADTHGEELDVWTPMAPWSPGWSSVRSLLPGAGDDGPSPGAVCFLQGGVVHFLQALWLAAPGVEPPHAFCVGMAMGRVRVGLIKNPTRKKICSGKNSDPNPHPRVKFQTRTWTRRVSGRVRVPVGFVNGPAQFSIGCWNAVLNRPA
jgi:hypothetical protein